MTLCRSSVTLEERRQQRNVSSYGHRSAQCLTFSLVIVQAARCIAASRCNRFAFAPEALRLDFLLQHE
jgi:hypothetical protein